MRCGYETAVAAAVAGGENDVIECGRGRFARPGPMMLQHIYISITCFYISLAERTHQQEGGGGGVMIE